MPRLKSYGVFISHAWDYSADYWRLVRMLRKAKYFNWRNCSVPKHDPLHARSDAELEKALRRQIGPANVVLIISGMYVKHREWIQKEIDIASEMGKRIVGIAPRGAERIPKEIQAVAPIIGWRTRQIVEAIRKPPKPQPGHHQARGADDRPDFSDLREWLKQPDEWIDARPGAHKRVVERRGGMGG